MVYFSNFAQIRQEYQEKAKQRHLTVVAGRIFVILMTAMSSYRLIIPVKLHVGLKRHSGLLLMWLAEKSQFLFTKEPTNRKGCSSQYITP